MQEHMTDAAIAAIGSKTTVAGAATSGLGWLVSNAFIGYLGLAIALVGVWINLHYRRREDRRREREHVALMRRLERDYERAAGE